MYKEKGLPAISLAIFASIILMLTIPFTAMTNRAYAHNFGGDESASFLAIVEEIKVELQLVRSNLPSNVTLATEHAEHTMEHLDNDTISEISERNQRLGTDLPASLDGLHDSLESGNFTASSVDSSISHIDDLLAETISSRIDKSQQTNSTVQALVLANVVNEVLEHYDGAYGIEEDESDSMNMTEMNSMSTSEQDNNAMQMGGNDSSMAMSNETDHATIVNMADYQSAQGYAAKALDIFNTKLKAMADANATQSISDLDAGLKHLKQAIDSKEPPTNIMVIGHGEVHPNIQKAFKLQLAPEFPLPLMLMMPALAAVVIAGRKLRFGRN